VLVLGLGLLLKLLRVQVNTHKHHALPKYIGGNKSYSKDNVVSIDTRLHKRFHDDMRKFAPTSRNYSKKYYQNLRETNRKEYKTLKKTYLQKKKITKGN
jgi:uncharacterized protein YeaO (DUF488 family)